MICEANTLKTDTRDINLLNKITFNIYFESIHVNLQLLICLGTWIWNDLSWVADTSCMFSGVFLLFHFLLSGAAALEGIPVLVLESKL